MASTLESGFARTYAAAAGVSAAVTEITAPFASARFPVFVTENGASVASPGIIANGFPSVTAVVDVELSSRFNTNRAPPIFTTKIGCMSVAVASPALPEEFTVMRFAPEGAESAALIVMTYDGVPPGGTTPEKVHFTVPEPAGQDQPPAFTGEVVSPFGIVSVSTIPRAKPSIAVWFTAKFTD